MLEGMGMEPAPKTPPGAPRLAALFVMADGPYSQVPGLDLWHAARDARQYPGPAPVVAHPPCERWGRYWFGGPSCKVRKVKGDDNGCFAAALASVRKWGGILEHPAASAAWAHFGLAKPPRAGGWVKADDFGGWTCCVDQLHYGHRAQKATWLYAFGCQLPELIWGKSVGGIRLDEGFHSAAERKVRKRYSGKLERLSKRQRLETPPAFRDLLLSIARTASARSSANLITSPRGEAAREAAPFFYPDPTLNFPQFSQFRNQPL
jgi:hypothetical protein